MTRISYALTALALGASMSMAHAVEPKAPNAPAVAATQTDRTAASSNTGGSAGSQASVLTDVDRYIIQRNTRRNR